MFRHIQLERNRIGTVNFFALNPYISFYNYIMLALTTKPQKL